MGKVLPCEPGVPFPEKDRNSVTGKGLRYGWPGLPKNTISQPPWCLHMMSLGHGTVGCGLGGINIPMSHNKQETVHSGVWEKEESLNEHARERVWRYVRYEVRKLFNAGNWLWEVGNSPLLEYKIHEDKNFYLLGSLLPPLAPRTCYRKNYSMTLVKTQ